MKRTLEADEGPSKRSRLEDHLRVLSDYLAEKKTDQPPGEKPKRCVHEGVETEEAYVCRKCGLVLDNLYHPDVRWFEHATLDREYTDADRLIALDEALVKFMEKTELRPTVPLFLIQERLRALKIDCGYKNLNYAIALTCILEGDREAQEKLSSFLPKSNVAWVRSWRLLTADPLPRPFLKSWLKNLLDQCPPKDLSKRQKTRFYRIIQHFDETRLKLMHDLMVCYGPHFYTDRVDLELLPFDLRHALYKFALAMSHP